jgi:rhodanese-related sulfurtransferase
MRAVTELALVLVLSSLGAVATWKIAGPPDRTVKAVVCDPAKIGPDEICLASVQAEWTDVLWIDARPEAEWKKNGVPGSIHLTTVGGGSFEEQLEASFERLGTAQRAVVYCGDVGCGISKEVVKRLREYGMPPEVKALHGGSAALQVAGLLKNSN